MLEKFGHFGNFMLPEFGQLIMVEERFHLSQMFYALKIE
jgi:hypothetical protein